MGKLAITIKQGETWFEDYRFWDDDGVVIPTAGATITAQIRKASDNTLIAEMDVSLLSDNWFKVQLEPSVTADIEKQQGLMWNIRFEKSDGFVIPLDPDTVTIINTITEP